MAARTASEAQPPLAKFLASNDKDIRDRAVASLRAFLISTPKPLPPDEMAKLWKAIFYCYWHSDKPLVQQALSSELASIPLAMEHTSRALDFLSGFWAMIVREWNGIDRLRMDKYYMLVRKFVNGGLRLLAREEWSETNVQRWNEMLSGKGAPLDPLDSRIPQSLGYHLSDIYLEELEKVVTDLAPDDPPPLPSLLAPFITDMALNPSKVTFDRVLSSLFSPLFLSLSTDTTPFPHLMALADISKMKKAVLKAWFDEASKSDTREANRKKMYRIWREEMADDELLEGGVNAE